MSDRIRTALEGSGTISIRIEVTNSNDVQLCVTESWARLTGIQRSEIKSHILDAADDPDKFIADELTHLFNKHINWKAAEPTYPDSTGEVTPAEPHTNQSSYGEMGGDEPGMGQFDKSPTLALALVKPAICARPKPSAGERLIRDIQAGTKVHLQPTKFEWGKDCGIHVTVEGINPTFSSLRTVHKELTSEQLTGAANPYGLVEQAVFELAGKIYGPI